MRKKLIPVGILLIMITAIFLMLLHSKESVIEDRRAEFAVTGPISFYDTQYMGWDISCIDDLAYFCYTDQKERFFGIACLDFDGNELNRIRLSEPSEPFLKSGNEYQWWNMLALGVHKQKIYAIYRYQYGMIMDEKELSESEGNHNYQLCTYNLDGQLENCVVVKGEMESETTRISLCCLDDGTFYYTGYKDGLHTLYHIAEDGTVLAAVNYDSYIRIFAVSDNDAAVVVCNKNIQMINNEKLNKQLKKYSIIDAFPSEKDSEYDFVFINTDGVVFGVDIQNSRIDSLFLHHNSMEGMVAESGIYRDNKLIQIGHPAIEGGGYIYSEGLNLPGVQEKIPLYVASVYHSSSFPQQIAEFNLNNPSYEIRVVSYETEEDPQKALSRDILKGKQFDMYDLGGIDQSFLVEKNLLADIYYYLERDAELDKAALSEHILSLYEKDGKLYTIVPGYFLHTIITDEEILQDVLSDSDVAAGEQLVKYDSWNYEIMWRAAEKNVKNSYAQELLYYSLFYKYDDIVDIENKSCCFTDGAFEELIRQASKLAYSEDGIGLGVFESLKMRGFTEVSLTFRDAAFITSYKKGDGTLNLAGYPDMSGGSSYIYEGNKLAIAADTKYPEIVWEFARQFLTEDYQVMNSYYTGMFATNKAAMERLNRTVMATEEYDDPLLGCILPYSGSNGLVTGVNASETGPAAADDVSRLAEQCETSDYMGKYDARILDMIMEEADACFLGQQDARMAAEQLQSRVSIYLQE